MGQEVRDKNKALPEKEALTRKEADELGIAYKPWHTCEAGEWGLTDDDYVLYTRRKNFLEGPRGKTWLFGYQRIRSKSCGPSGERQPFRYGDRIGFFRGWVDHELRKSRTKSTIKLYVHMLLTGTVDWDVLGNTYRPDQEVPRATVKRLFKQEKVKQVIREEVAKALAAKNITQESVLDMYLEAHSVAKAKTDAATMTRVAEDLTDILDMKPGKESKSFSFEMTQDLAELVMGEEKKVQKLQDKPAQFEDLELDATGSSPETEG